MSLKKWYNKEEVYQTKQYDKNINIFKIFYIKIKLFKYQVSFSNNFERRLKYYCHAIKISH